MRLFTRKQKAIYIFLSLVGLCIVVSSFSLYDTGRSLYTKIELFSTILRRIHSDYVDIKDSEDLVESAIKGMVSSLDPHTTYLTKEHFERWNQSFEGYSGIGITFDVIRNKITIMSVFQEGPSDKVGLLPGDRIVEINGKMATGMKRDDVPLKLMGPKGTTVEVGVERQGWDKPKSFTITRDEIHVESVPYSFILKPDVGYVNIARFSLTTGEEVEEALKKLDSKGVKYLILDLRQNGGGYLEAAVEVVDKFLPRGKRIVYTQGRIGSSFREFYSTERKTHPFMVLMVLIDRTSASASEIVAGSLQDWDRALILGETSFGKGLVQSQYRFRDGSALLMTTAKYYTPTGRLIQRPFDDKSAEEYYREIIDDSLRNDLENDRSRKVYKSGILKRKVYGGGGITPDIFLSARRDTTSQIVRDILFHPERPFFTFVEDYLKDRSELRMEFNEFIKYYQPNGKVLELFFSHINNLGIQLTNLQLMENKKDILFFLKQTIANKIWGDEARFKVQLLRDHHLVEAIDYLPEAESLLKKAYPQEVAKVLK